MNHRLSDQVMILQAIDKVRAELMAAHERGDNWLKTGEIIVRLGTLYSLLDTARITDVLSQADSRENTRNKFQNIA